MTPPCAECTDPAKKKKQRKIQSFSSFSNKVHNFVGVFADFYLGHEELVDNSPLPVSDGDPMGRNRDGRRRRCCWVGVYSPELGFCGEAPPSFDIGSFVRREAGERRGAGVARDAEVHGFFFGEKERNWE